MLRLTLLKSAIRPDATADQGKHEFTYSLLPHAHSWREGGVVEEAYALNYPLHYAPLLAKSEKANRSTPLPARYQFATVDADNVIIETVKRAEDGDAWIIRVYEFKQYRQNNVHLCLSQAIQKAVECNLIEEEEHPIEYTGDHIMFSIAPFEIKTFKVWF